MSKILVFADCKGWVFERHFLELKKRLPEHDFHCIFLWNEQPQNQSRYNGFDMFYLMDPIPVAFNHPPRNKTIIGLRNEFMYKHTPHDIQNFFNSTIKPKASFFHVVNRKQFDEFSAASDIPFFLTQHGVDIECFKYDSSRRKSPTSEFIVGTSGSPISIGNKGFVEIEKVCKQNGWKLVSAKQNLSGRQLTKEEMPAFYQTMDVYVCFSESEGLNNCIMEAGAMGVPIVSTNTGASKEMILKNECGFVIERNESALTNALTFIKENRVHAQSMGDNMKNVVTNHWSWNIKIQDYRHMFNFCLEHIRWRERQYA